MKPLELRIGNLVILSISNVNHYGKIHSLTPYHLLIGDGIKCDYCDLQPILLTEEWLLKLGFIKDIGKRGEYYLHNRYSGFRVWKSDITSCWVIGRKQFDNNVTYWIADLKFVHQLQNLFYALTGEELIIDAYSPVERQQMQDKLDEALNESTQITGG